MGSMISDIREAVGAKGSLQEICSGLVTFLSGKKDEGLIYFKTVLTQMSVYDWVDEISSEFLEFDIVPDSRLPEIIRLENNLISKQIEKRVSEEEFYAELWKRLWDDVVLPNDEDRIAFFQILWTDNRIPYFEIGEGNIIQEDDFQKIRKKIAPAIQKGKFIMDANLKHKTQWSSLLMELANSLEDETERVVFWAVLIGSLRDKIKALFSMMSDEATPDEETKKEE